jgi:hypothetical protein
MRRVRLPPLRMTNLPSMPQLPAPFRASSKETVLPFKNVSSSGLQVEQGVPLRIMPRYSADVLPSRSYIEDFW